MARTRSGQLSASGSGGPAVAASVELGRGTSAGVGVAFPRLPKDRPPATPDPPPQDSFRAIVYFLRKHPTYLFMLGTTMVVAVFGGLYFQEPWNAIVFIAGLVAALVTVYLVNSRFAAARADKHSVAASDAPDSAHEAKEEPKEQGRPVLTRNEIARVERLRQSVETVLRDASHRDSDLYIVYSSHPVNQLLDQDGREIELKKTKHRRVVVLKDAQGIAHVQGLLYQAGKDQNIHSITTDLFQEDLWQEHLILVGANPSNPRTHQALSSFESPLTFSSDAKVIEHVSSGERWPKDATDSLDYGMVTRIKRTVTRGEVIYIILAGVTSTATRACCDYFASNIDQIAKDCGDQQFASVISVNRDAGIPQRVQTYTF